MSAIQHHGIGMSLAICPALGDEEALRPGDVVQVWRRERDGYETYLGEGRLAGWLQRLRVYEQRGEGYSPPYFVIGNTQPKATRNRDVRMPVVELVWPEPTVRPPETPIYPKCPDCGGDLALEQGTANGAVMQCAGFAQHCDMCDGLGVYEEWGSTCPACGGEGWAPREGCGSLFVDTRESSAEPVPVL